MNIGPQKCAPGLPQNTESTESSARDVRYRQKYRYTEGLLIYVIPVMPPPQAVTRGRPLPPRLHLLRHWPNPTQSNLQTLLWVPWLTWHRPHSCVFPHYRFNQSDDEYGIENSELGEYEEDEDEEDEDEEEDKEGEEGEGEDGEKNKKNRAVSLINL